MAKDFAEQLSRIGHKAELLVTRFSTLKQENEELRAEILQLQARQRALTAQIEKLQMQLDHLRISSVIAPDTEAARQARTILSDLVREIDACVADLMKDV